MEEKNGVEKEALRKGLLSGYLRKHGRETDPVTFGDELLKKRQH